MGDYLSFALTLSGCVAAGLLAVEIAHRAGELLGKLACRILRID